MFGTGSRPHSWSQANQHLLVFETYKPGHIWGVSVFPTATLATRTIHSPSALATQPNGSPPSVVPVCAQKSFRHLYGSGRSLRCATVKPTITYRPPDQPWEVVLPLWGGVVVRGELRGLIPQEPRWLLPPPSFSWGVLTIAGQTYTRRVINDIGRWELVGRPSTSWDDVVLTLDWRGSLIHLHD
jgi:hypothetical protein